MARTRQLSDLRTDARRLADLENATARFPDAEVTEYVNKGLAYVYKEMITAQDRPFFITEVNVQILTAPLPGQVSPIPLPLDYIQLVSVSWASSANGPWLPMDPYEEAERAVLLSAGAYGTVYGGFKYGIAASPGALTIGTIPTSNSIEVLPPAPLGSYVKIRYVPTCPRLVNDVDTFDGILGFEDAACTWAAILMRRKDDLETASLLADLAIHMERIHAIARRRDRSRPPKTQIVRGWGGAGRGPGWRRWGGL